MITIDMCDLEKTQYKFDIVKGSFKYSFLYSINIAEALTKL